MTLSPLTRVGAYEIQSLIGSGGMGEVYRVRDTRLGRDVALKILPSAFNVDRERLARFEREARLLASLNRVRSILSSLERSDWTHRTEAAAFILGW